MKKIKKNRNKIWKLEAPVLYWVQKLKPENKKERNLKWQDAVRFSPLVHRKVGTRMEKKEMILKPAEKFCLTVQEASQYFELGDKKIRELAKTHMDDGIFVMHGVKLLVLRPRFEEYLAKTPEI